MGSDSFFQTVNRAAPLPARRGPAAAFSLTIPMSMNAHVPDPPRRPSPIIRYFAYEHLPERLQGVSKPIGDLALSMDELLPDGA